MQTREVLIGEIVTFEPVKAFETPPLVSTSFCLLGIHLFRSEGFGFRPVREL